MLTVLDLQVCAAYVCGYAEECYEIERRGWRCGPSVAC